MALLSSILGFSLFGLSARIGQLGIQKRNLLESTSSFPSPPSSTPSHIRLTRVADFFLLLLLHVTIEKCIAFIVIRVARAFITQTLEDISFPCSLSVILVIGHIGGTSGRRYLLRRSVQRSRSGASKGSRGLRKLPPPHWQRRRNPRITYQAGTYCYK